MVFGDVAEQVRRLDEVIAGVHVAGVFHREREPAGLAVDAHPRLLADEVRQRGIEHLHVDLGDVSPDPFLEDVDQEPAVPGGRHRAVRDLLAGLGVEGPVAPG